MKLKFGDKVQLVKISEETYRNNVLNGRDPVRFSGYVHLGDVGVVVREATTYDKARVLFSTDSNYMVVSSDEVMLESDESNLKVIENSLKLQELKIDQKSYKSLGYKVIYDSTRLKIGCQNVTKEDALQIAADITEHFKA